MSTYIDVEFVAPKSTANINPPIDIYSDVTFTWSVTASSFNPTYRPKQVSAVFGWRLHAGDPYVETTITGSDKSVTIPANTFSSGGYVFTRVVVTDESGTTGTAYGSYFPLIAVDIPLIGGAGIRSASPDQNFPWAQPLYKNLGFLSADIEYRSLFMFDTPPAAYKYKAIISGGLYCKVSYVNNTSYIVIGGDIYALPTTFSASLVTWDTAPVGENIGDYVFPLESTENQTMQLIPYFMSSGSHSKIAAKMANSVGLMITGPTYYKDLRYITIAAPMSLRLWIEDTIVTSKPEAAKYAAGYVNPHIAQTFSWNLVPDGSYYCFGGWEQTSATFSYRAGTSGDWTEVEISGSDQHVTIAAETLPSGTVQWKVETTDDQGTTAESEVYEINTTDSDTTATPIIPKATIENGDAEIRFEWEIDNDNGTAPTGADLQYSTTGSSGWTTFAQITTSATEYDAPAGTFTNGTRYWRVRAYNADGVAGDWSDALTFVVVAAPPAPVVSADGKPYATISWQSSGQMAYRVTVDGRSFGPYFGTAKSFETPDFLTDGSHTAEVSVQGEAGLWSQPGSVTFQVTNVPGQPVSLTGKFGRDAALRWSTEATVANFYIYRDGIRIGHTAVKQFTDRFVLGAHEYFVINKLPGGYYTRSNLASGTMRSCTRAVAAFSGSDWLEMALSDESDTTEEFAWNQVVSERYVTGSDLPVVETSPYRSGSGSYRISFASVETGAAFEALRGQKVIVKSRGGNVAIGVLSGYTKTMGNFYINYVFSVRNCSWEDYVDETGD